MVFGLWVFVISGLRVEVFRLHCLGFRLRAVNNILC